MVDYFQSQGATNIVRGKPPANWMLSIMAADGMQDLAEDWLKSEVFAKIKRKPASIYTGDPDPEKKIDFETEFAAPFKRRLRLVTKRLQLIYWCSPSYNLARLSVSAVIAFVLGSVFILKRSQTTYSETDIRAPFSVVFFSFVIVGIMAILSTLPVMTNIRDMFYLHRVSGTYVSLSIGLALGFAEKLFIVLASWTFVCVF